MAKKETVKQEELNKEFEYPIYEVKNQSLSLQQFLEFRNWVCTRLMNIEEFKIEWDLAGIIMQFAFAKFYLNIELPNVDTENELDDYELVCMVEPNDYANYINWNQYVQLDLSISRFLKEIEEEYREAKSYSVNDFLQDIIVTIDNFSKELVGSLNLGDIDISDLIAKMDEFTMLSNGKINSDEFLDNVLNHADKIKEAENKAKEEALTEKEDKKNVN